MKSGSAFPVLGKTVGRAKSKKLFDPVQVSTDLERAVSRDLESLSQVYGGLIPEAEKSATRQVLEFLKKFQAPNQDTSDLEVRAFEDFKDINRHMSVVNKELQFPSPNIHIQRSVCRMDKIHLRARALMHSVLGSFVEDEFHYLCKHSSGASRGVPYKDTSIEAKFTLPMTCTHRAKRLFERHLNFNFQLKSAIESFNGSDKEWYLYESGSRATTVEKDLTKRRFIAVEPTVNMYLQQGLMEMMYLRMEKVGLSVERLPQQHRRRAWKSSLTGREATIDWSQASDSVAYELVKWLLPFDWFSYLDMVRSPTTSIGDEIVDLNMFSSMGNAVTFPLETLVFWTYAHAVILTENDKTNTLFPEWEKRRSVSVFGDDCIVKSKHALRYIEVMSSIGFKVNKEKSYFTETGRFRESCGGDFLAGYPNRPFNLKGPTSTRVSALEPWLYTILNGMTKKYILYFGANRYVYDKALYKHIFRLFRRYELQIKLVPPDYPEDAGFKGILDIHRFSSAYPGLINLSPVYEGDHGVISFLFCNFRYWKRKKQDSGLRYSLWLTKSVTRETLTERSTTWRPIRKGGGYVVARGFSSFWDVPWRNSTAR